MVRALDLPKILRSAGLPVVEVPGWQNRGAPLSGIRGGVSHHTATPGHIGGDYPTLPVIIDGHRTLAGPLSQLGLGKSGTWYVVASGRANHAGTVHARYSGTHSNPYALGVEAEHPGGDAPWPAAQYNSYVVGCGALGRAYGITWLGHKEVAAPAGRKTDPNFNMDTFRSLVGTSTVANPIPGSGGALPYPSIPAIDPIEPVDLDELENKMRNLRLARLVGQNTVWVGDGVTRRPIASETELTDLQHRIRLAGGVPGVEEVGRIEWLGVAPISLTANSIAKAVWGYFMDGGDTLQPGNAKIPRETAGERLRQIRRQTQNLRNGRIQLKELGFQIRDHLHQTHTTPEVVQQETPEDAGGPALDGEG